jgi:ubiquinone/menaquinone biosynthesis C-methylase UbiE
VVAQPQCQSHFARVNFELTDIQEIPRELYDLGYTSQCSVDFSAVAINAMRERFGALEGLQWEVMDIRNMPFEANSFDVAFDKVSVYTGNWEPANYV